MAEDRFVANVLSLDANLHALSVSSSDFLTDDRVEDLDAGGTIAERPRSRAGDVRRWLRERGDVEVIVQPFRDGPGGTRIADQVWPLRAVPDLSSGLCDVK